MTSEERKELKEKIDLAARARVARTGARVGNQRTIDPVNGCPVILGVCARDPGAVCGRPTNGDVYCGIHRRYATADPSATLAELASDKEVVDVQADRDVRSPERRFGWGEAVPEDLGTDSAAPGSGTGSNSSRVPAGNAAGAGDGQRRESEAPGSREDASPVGTLHRDLNVSGGPSYWLDGTVLHIIP